MRRTLQALGSSLLLPVLSLGSHIHLPRLHSLSCLQPGFSFLEFSGTIEDVIGVWGNALCLQSNHRWKNKDVFEWKKQQESSLRPYTILTWDYFKGMNCSNFDPNSKNTFSLNNEDLILLIKSLKPQDSGHYILEVTNSSGHICRKSFTVLILGEFQLCSLCSSRACRTCIPLSNQDLCFQILLRSPTCRCSGRAWLTECAKCL